MLGGNFNIMNAKLFRPQSGIEGEVTTEIEVVEIAEKCQADVKGVERLLSGQYE